MLSDFDKAEIRVQYRDAADKRKQIGILADLYACGKEDILNALNLDTENDTTVRSEPAAQKKKRIVRSYDQAVKKDVVKAILLDGNTHEAVAERFGIPLSTVTHWVQRAKKAQAKVMADADAIAKAPLPSASTKCEKEESERKALGMCIIQELRAGINGLHAFMDNFAGVDILSDDERSILDRILHTASGFADGFETGIALAEKAQQRNNFVEDDPCKS